MKTHYGDRVEVPSVLCYFRVVDHRIKMVKRVVGKFNA
jgi:hypothetical protein